MGINVKITSYARLTTLMMWLGFILVVTPEVIFFAAEPDEKITETLLDYTKDPNTGRWVVSKATTIDKSPLNPMLYYCLGFNIAGWIFWLYCLHRLHRVLAEITNKTYPISPAKAVWSHCIPVYNLFWVFKWTNGVVRYIAEAQASDTTKRWPGVILFIALILAYVGSIPPRFGVGSHAIALAITLAVGIYLSKKIISTITLNTANEE